MQRRTFLAGTSLLTSAAALSPSACQDPTLILAAIEPESQARLLIRAATLAQRAGRLNEALHLAHSARELARGLPYREVTSAYLAVLWGDYARLHHDVPALETAHEAARDLHGIWLHDGDIKQVQLELALLSTPRAATDLLRLTFDVWYQPREMRSDGSWHWARAGFVVKSLEALILGAYPAQARELATFFAHNSPHSFTVYEALRWEWTAIRLRLFGTLAQRRAFRGQATRAGYLRQAVIAL